jgi:hypothetical protein
MHLFQMLKKSSSKGILFPIGNKPQIRILDPF